MNEKKETVLTRIDNSRKIIKGNCTNEYIIITRDNRYKIQLIDKKLYINGDVIEVPKEDYYSHSSFDYVMKLDGIILHFLGKSNSLDIVYNGEFATNKSAKYMPLKRAKKEAKKAIFVIVLVVISWFIIDILKLPMKMRLIAPIIGLLISLKSIINISKLELDARYENDL